MKITCDCGNGMIFNTTNEDTGKENEITEDEGQYATNDYSKYFFGNSTMS